MKNLTPWQWVGFTFLFAVLSAIPLVGIFLSVGVMAYLAFGDKYKNHVLNNYAKGTLISYGIVLAIVLLVGAVIGFDVLIDAYTGALTY